MNILVIDVGTTSMRGILFNTQGEKQHTVSRENSPSCISSIIIEQEPLTWRRELVYITKDVVKYCENNNLSIDAISLTSQRSSIIPVDKNGDHISNAIMWQDKRNSEIAEKMKKHNDLIHDKTGANVNTVFTATKIKWLKENMKHIYDQAYKILVIPDYLNVFMTGQFKTDTTYGGRTLLMNLRTKQWDQELLALFNIDQEKLCDLVDVGSIVGSITPGFSKLTGLKVGIPVITAGGDQQCAALGLGVIDDGTLEITTGTGSFMIASTSKLNIGQKNLTYNPSAIEGKYIIEASTLTSSAVYNWFNHNFYNIDDNHKFQMINEEVNSSPVGSNGVVLLPHFQGSGSRDWNASARGMFLNLTLSTTRADMARSILEGIAAEIKGNIEYIEKDIGPIKNIYVAGGLTNLDAFNQIQSDMYNKKVIKYKDQESTAIGAWCSAAVSLGIYKSHHIALKMARKTDYISQYLPHHENVANYINLYRKFEHSYKVFDENKLYDILKN